MTLIKKRNIFIVTMDRGKAKIYKQSPDDKNLTDIYSLTNDNVRKREGELRADRPGSGQGFNSNIQYTMDEHVSYKQQESDAFIKELSAYLSSADIATQYDTLIVVSPAEVYNHFHKIIPADVKDKLSKHHAKNVSNMPLAEFQEYFRKHIS